MKIRCDAGDDDDGCVGQRVGLRDVDDDNFVEHPLWFLLTALLVTDVVFHFVLKRYPSPFYRDKAAILILHVLSCYWSAINFSYTKQMGIRNMWHPSYMAVWLNLIVCVGRLAFEMMMLPFHANVQT